MTEQAKAPPAFQFYASDIMADRRYRCMNLSERGLFLSMLCECWVNRSVPADIDNLSKVLGFTKDEVKEALSERVLSFFRLEKGELINTGLAEYRQGLDERKEKQSQGGRRGARAKWDKPLARDSYPNSPPCNQANGVSMGSRVEQSRVETSRAESSRNGEDNKDNASIDPWIVAYDAHASDLDVGLPPIRRTHSIGYD